MLMPNPNARARPTAETRATVLTPATVPALLSPVPPVEFDPPEFDPVPLPELLPSPFCSLTAT